MDAIWQNFIENIWLYLSIPVTSALVGWGTNTLAIKMMFLPLEFRGLKPIFGWQGIVPRKAAMMASIAVETMTTKLLNVQDVFNRLDPQRVAAELEPPLLNMVDEITDDVMQEHEPALWNSLPEPIRQQIIARVQREMPQIVKNLMENVRQDIDHVFDLRDMVVSNLIKDKALLNRIFMETGLPEFKFIGISGLYFGFIFGLLQMLIWVFLQVGWLLPLFGLIVGWATNFIALKMIFQPREPRKIGPITFHGLFLRRQKQVAADYGQLIADEILTPANIIEAILKGPYSDKLFHTVHQHVAQALDDTAGIGKPMIKLAVGTHQYQAIKHAAIVRMLARMPDTLKHIETYAEDALDIRNTLSEKMQQLSPTEFEGLLRPAFEQDEWLLIAVGAALGFAVGCFQLFVLFGQALMGQ